MSMTTYQQKYIYAHKLIGSGKYGLALRELKELDRIQESKEVKLTLGNVYLWRGDNNKAAKCFIAADDENTPLMNGKLVKHPYAEAQNNLGTLASALEDNDSAIAYFNKAIMYGDSLHTRNGAIWNMSHTLLKKYLDGESVDLATAFWGYDTRLALGECSVFVDGKVQRWKEGPVTILHEQGTGDRLMFGRYLKLLDDVTVQCIASERTFFKDFKTILVGEKIETPGLAFCSLWGTFKHIANGEWLANRLERKQSGFKIGVVASGSPTHGNAKFRNTKLSYFSELDKYGELYTLNPAEHGKMYKNMGNTTWDETISVLGSMDLVISVDTSIVHLCGSMGVPCWVLMPLRGADFRWGSYKSGPNNRWYRSVEVVRNPGSWEYVFDVVKKELHARYK